MEKDGLWELENKGYKIEQGDGGTNKHQRMHTRSQKLDLFTMLEVSCTPEVGDADEEEGAEGRVVVTIGGVFKPWVRVVVVEETKRVDVSGLSYEGKRRKIGKISGERLELFASTSKLLAITTSQ